MAFEEHKQQKINRYINPYADYEYVSKRSRQPWRSLVVTLLFGFALFWFAWERWHEISAAEQTGTSVSMSSIEWGLYKISGKWGITSFFGLLGAVIVYFAFHSYRRLEKMKRS